MSRSSRTRLDVDERRNLLLDAAAQLFEQRAFDEVSIEDVAQAAGVSKGLIYHYFTGKRELYVAHVERGAGAVLTAILEAVGAVESDADADTRVRAALRGWMLHVRAHARTYEAVVRGGTGSDADVRRIAADLRTQFADLLSAVFGSRARSELGRIAILGWIGFVESATLAWIDSEPTSEPDATIDVSIEVLDAALRATEAPG